MRRVVDGYLRVVDRLSEWTGWLAIGLIFVMLAVMLADVIARKVLDVYMIWTLEFLQFTFAAMYFLGGAKTLKDETHVRMDLFYGRLSERGRARLDLLTVFCLIVYLGVMFWGSISSLAYSWQTGQRLPSPWRPSVVPIKALMTVCLGLMLLQSLALLIRYARAAVGRVAVA